MTNQQFSSRLFERGKFKITRHDGKPGEIITKENTQRKFCVELGSRKWGRGTGLIVEKLPFVEVRAHD